MKVKSIKQMVTEEIREEIRSELSDVCNATLEGMRGQVFDEMFLEYDLKECFTNYYAVPIDYLSGLIEEAYPFVLRKGVDFIPIFEVYNGSGYDKYTGLCNIKIDFEISLTEREREIVDVIAEELKEFIYELYVGIEIEFEEIPEDEIEVYGEGYRLVS